jgi:hypothetical protein
MRYLIRSLFPVVSLFFCHSLNAQQAPASPRSPAAPAVPGKSNPPVQAAPDKGKTKPIPSFLIVGTVFNENALSFPGVQVRIRRAGETKFTWETFTNSRGEFAVRVPPGYEYEVLVRTKKYKDQTKSVDSKVDVQQRLSIQLEPVTQNTGAKS